MEGKKNPQINLPLRITFTEEGILFFRKHNKKLEKQYLSDNTVGYGISLAQYTASSIQRMIVADYISRIEVVRTTFTVKRSEIMDTSKLIFYGILYKRFSNCVISRILKTTFVAHWNRTNPKGILDELSIHRFDSSEKLTAGINDKIGQYKNEIVSKALFELSESSDPGEEKDKLRMLGIKYLEHLDRFIWYVLSVEGEYGDYNSLLSDIVKMLATYIEKAKIAEYLSLMIMEFSINAELSQLKQLSNRLYKDKIDFNKILSNAIVRTELLKYLEKHQEFLTLSWKIHSSRTSIGTDNKLQVVIFNKDQEYQKLKKDIDNKKSVDIRKKSLLDYYQEESEEQFSSDLGLYYLSFMDEACREQQIHFEANINQLPERGLNIITLTLRFQ